MMAGEWGQFGRVINFDLNFQRSNMDLKTRSKDHHNLQRRKALRLTLRKTRMEILHQIQRNSDVLQAQLNHLMNSGKSAEIRQFIQ